MQLKPIYIVTNPFKLITYQAIQVQKYTHIIFWFHITLVGWYIYDNKLTPNVSNKHFIYQ